MSKRESKKESRRTAMVEIAKEMGQPRRTASVRRALEEEETRKKPNPAEPNREEQRLEANCEPSNPRYSRENPAA